MTLILLAYTRIAGRARSTERASQEWVLHFAKTAVAVLVVSWLLTLRIGSFSLYWLLYHLVPGAAAIRVGGQIQLLVNLWVVAAVAMLIDRRIAAAPLGSRKLEQIGAAAVLLFCVAEQVNLFQVGLPRSQTLTALAAVPSPPVECGSFLVAVPGGRATTEDHADAMWISLKTGLPTLDGTSPWSPPGWRLSDPSIDYLAAARSWIRTSNPPGQTCLYDRRSRQWSLFDAGK